ncbi:hypothetical protein SK128_023116 [Halocaridina rubra]|uniref:CUB domain-containing protein n=1 Tax=Halocaridina rubra TaxID=373956 RepID=A0AAN9ACP9_HALRR
MKNLEITVFILLFGIIVINYGTAEARLLKSSIPDLELRTANNTLIQPREGFLIQTRNDSLIQPKVDSNSKYLTTFLGCGTHTLVPGLPYAIKSKRYPELYPKGHRCTWNLNVRIHKLGEGWERE